MVVPGVQGCAGSCVSRWGRSLCGGKWINKAAWVLKSPAASLHVSGLLSTVPLSFLPSSQGMRGSLIGGKMSAD